MIIIQAWASSTVRPTVVLLKAKALLSYLNRHSDHEKCIHVPPTIAIQQIETMKKTVGNWGLGTLFWSWQPSTSTLGMVAMVTQDPSKHFVME